MAKLQSQPAAYLQRAFVGASRSSAFLATFVIGVWGGVCYGRTRIGPKIVPNQQFCKALDTIGACHDTRKLMQPAGDGGAAMMLGTFLCGWVRTAMAAICQRS